ncbi:hypothetical protein QZH41_004041 [Actinostola sp. cb2023]|nr:hypothetical protein QZH41_004041 [Actinostola sp. cb2023]
MAHALPRFQVSQHIDIKKTAHFELLTSNAREPTTDDEQAPNSSASSGLTSNEPKELLLVSELSPDDPHPVKDREDTPNIPGNLYRNSLLTIDEDKQLDIIYTPAEESHGEAEKQQQDSDDVRDVSVGHPLQGDKINDDMQDGKGREGDTVIFEESEEQNTNDSENNMETDGKLLQQDDDDVETAKEDNTIVCDEQDKQQLYHSQDVDTDGKLLQQDDSKETSRGNDDLHGNKGVNEEQEELDDSDQNEKLSQQTSIGHDGENLSGASRGSSEELGNSCGKDSNDSNLVDDDTTRMSNEDNEMVQKSEDAFKDASSEVGTFVKTKTALDFVEVFDEANDLIYCERPVLSEGVSSGAVILEWEDSTSVSSPDYCVMVLGERFNSDVDSQKRIVVLMTSRDSQCMHFRSDIMTLTMPGRPKAPVIRVITLKDREFTISWRTPCCYGDAIIVGYKLLINGSQHGDLLPHDAVQHTVGNLQHDHMDETKVELSWDKPPGGTPHRIKVSEVRVVSVTCCAVEVQWSLAVEDKSERGDNALLVHPEGYRVKFWKSEELTELELVTLQTKDTTINVTDLTPSCRYAVVVEAFANHPNYTTDSLKWNVSKSEKIRFDTKPPPDPPENLRIVSRTLTSVCLSWDPLNTKEGLRFIYLDVYKMDSDEESPTDALMHFKINPHMTSYTIHSLDSKTLYLFNVRTSYSQIDSQNERQHCCGTNSSIKAWTGGVDRPRDLHVTKRTPFSLHVAWQPAVTYGNLQVLYYQVHYMEKKSKSPHGGTPTLIDGNTLRVPQGSVLGRPQSEIRGLEPGVVYNITVEAVVKLSDRENEAVEENQANDADEVASSIDSSESDWVSLIAQDCLSKSITVSTVAPSGIPVLLVTGMSATQIHLSWNKPSALQLGM